MAKFKMIVTEPDTITISADGKQATKPGKVYLVPEDDIAKVSQKAGEAMRAGVWTPEDPKEREKASLRLSKAHANEDVRRGVIQKDDYEDRVKMLQKTIYRVR